MCWFFTHAMKTLRLTSTLIPEAIVIVRQDRNQVLINMEKLSMYWFNTHVMKTLRLTSTLIPAAIVIVRQDRKQVLINMKRLSIITLAAGIKVLVILNVFIDC